MIRMNLKKEDMVRVIAGKEKGKTGRIIKVITKKNKVVVEKINMIKRNMKPTKSSPQGGIMEKEAALNLSNVMIVCPDCGSAVRFGFKTLEDGKKVRICSKCHEAIDK